jgi:ABC-type multidrug transport system ATPase subunit
MGDVERLADRFAVLVGGQLVATLTERELRAKLADRGVMKVTLDRWLPGVLDTVLRLAPSAVRAGETLVVPGPASGRPAVLDAIRGAGGIVTGLTAEEGRLDDFYRELVGGPA